MYSYSDNSEVYEIKLTRRLRIADANTDYHDSMAKYSHRKMKETSGLRRLGHLASRFYHGCSAAESGASKDACKESLDSLDMY